MCFRMESYLIGNSIVKDIRSREFITISLPGANWQDIIRYVKERANRFTNSIIYIHVGPVRFTRIHRTENRKEMQLVNRNTGTVDSIFQEWRPLRENNTIPVICTLYPADFEKYNNHLAGSSTKREGRRIIQVGRQILRGFYAENTNKIRGMVVEENKDIVGYNKSHEMCTPFMHNKIFTRRRQYYNFRSTYLCDGLHPTRDIVSRWKEEVERVIRLNKVKMDYMRRQWLRHRERKNRRN